MNKAAAPAVPAVLPPQGAPAPAPEEKTEGVLDIVKNLFSFGQANANAKANAQTGGKRARRKRTCGTRRRRRTSRR
jgi:hypothetical protein